MTNCSDLRPTQSSASGPTTAAVADTITPDAARRTATPRAEAKHQTVNVGWA